MNKIFTCDILTYSIQKIGGAIDSPITTPYTLFKQELTQQLTEKEIYQFLIFR